MDSVGVNSPADILDARRQAARLAAKAEIRDVRLLKSSAEVTDIPATGSVFTYDLNSEANVDYEPGSTSFVVRFSYQLSIKPAESAEQNEPPSATSVASIEFEQAALFVIELGEDEEPLREEELTSYAVTTGQFALHPFAREYIYDVTGRLGLPPLTVGILSMPWNEMGETPFVRDPERR